jgi:hypothetical protein
MGEYAQKKAPSVRKLHRTSLGLSKDVHIKR